MVKMTKNSAMGGLLEPINNSAIRKSVLHKVVLRKTYIGVSKTLHTLQKCCYTLEFAIHV